VASPAQRGRETRGPAVVAVSDGAVVDLDAHCEMVSAGEEPQRKALCAWRFAHRSLPLARFRRANCAASSGQPGGTARLDVFGGGVAAYDSRGSSRAAVTIEFLITSLIVVATPGTGVVYTVAAGLSRGARASSIAAFGCTLGIIPHMLAAITGLAALLHTSALAFQTLKYLGVAYLVYMAWTTLREHGALRVEGSSEPRSTLSVIVSGVLLNLLNPKLTIFFFAFLPQFVAPDERHAFLRMLGLSGIFMLMTLIVFVIYGRFAAAMRDRVMARPRVMAWLRRGFAGAFVALGARLAFTDR
jgi:threonine/homoserine/homoserine lactone efflux protein